MRVDDFMNSGGIRSCGTIVPDEYKIYNDIDSYRIISYDKKELIKSMFKYIKCFPYNPELAWHVKQRNALSQCEINGQRCLVRFNIISFEADDDSYFSHDKDEFISKQEFNNRVNKYNRVGSQRTATVSIGLPYRGINFNVSIYYTEDGHVYLCDSVAEAISQADVYKIGEKLAQSAQKQNDYGYYDRINNDVLESRYKHGKDRELYTSVNCTLYKANTYRNEPAKQKKKSFWDFLK